MPRRLQEWLGPLPGSGPRRAAEPAVQPNLLRRIWPTARVAPTILFVILLFGGRLLDSARLIRHGLALELILASVALVIVLTAVEAVLERLGLIDKAQTAKPLMDLSEIPVRPAAPPIPETASRAEVARPPGAALGGAIPPQFAGRAGVSWGLEGGYVWRPGEPDPG